MLGFLFRTLTAAPAEGTALFDQVVARSGLSSVIAATTVARACNRANVDPELLNE